VSKSAYQEHVSTLSTNYSDAIERACSSGSQIDCVLLHSGSEHHYFADDRHIPFQAYGHFHHWLPVNRPDQFILVQAGEAPIYFQVLPDDFWYEQSIENESWWADHVQIVRLNSVDKINEHLPKSAIAYLGPEIELAESLGIESSLVNPKSMVSCLDWHRAIKTEYELEQLTEASRVGVLAHNAARECFLNGGSEYDIHMAFLQTCNILEEESPYTNIVALDEKSAILHYQNKRRKVDGNGHVLLIDAGCRINGYGSDITRTWVKPDAHPLFQSLLSSMIALEQELVATIKPKMEYKKFQEAALAGVAKILQEADILQTDSDDLLEQGIPQLFMPHGVGHLLGIQVHDVGGHQKDISGASTPPPEHSPSLRNTRILDEDMVFTIEPGLYFIPLLLEKERDSDKGKCINWSLVEDLYPCGGIRIEDNVRVREEGAENLTRKFE
jgi:Xaa-Pro dipeptidase